MVVWVTEFSKKTRVLDWSETIAGGTSMCACPFFGMLGISTPQCRLSLLANETADECNIVT